MTDARICDKKDPNVSLMKIIRMPRHIHDTKRENGLKVIRRVHVFLVFTQITLNTQFYHMAFEEGKL